MAAAESVAVEQNMSVAVEQQCVGWRRQSWSVQPQPPLASLLSRSRVALHRTLRLQASLT